MREHALLILAAVILVSAAPELYERLGLAQDAKERDIRKAWHVGVARFRIRALMSPQS
jgi:hypothetical protein